MLCLKADRLPCWRCCQARGCVQWHCASPRRICRCAGEIELSTAHDDKKKEQEACSLQADAVTLRHARKSHGPFSLDACHTSTFIHAQRRVYSMCSRVLYCHWCGEYCSLALHFLRFRALVLLFHGRLSVLNLLCIPFFSRSFMS